MRKYLLILLLIPALLLLQGCKNPEQAAYKVTGSVILTANSAMSAWLDYKNTHPVPPDQVAMVKGAWDKFYVADQAEQHAIIAYKTSTDTNGLNIAISMASAASADLITLVMQFLPPANAAALKGVK